MSMILYEGWISDSIIGTYIPYIESIYDRFQKEADEFVRSSRLSCPEGCGSCCERFEPDVYPIEADYAALYIIRNKPGLLPRLDEAPANTAGPHPRGCPLYEPHAKEHCPIYPARPLICRGFAFSAMTSKRGGAVFRLCSKMSVPFGNSSRRLWKDGDIPAKFGAAAPVLDRFGRMIADGPGSSGGRELLGTALRRSARKLLFYKTHYRPDDPSGDKNAA